MVNGRTEAEKKWRGVTQAVPARDCVPESNPFQSFNSSPTPYSKNHFCFLFKLICFLQPNEFKQISPRFLHAF